MSNAPSASSPSDSEKSSSQKSAEQSKAAVENVSEGYGSTIKSRLISGKPDGDTQGGPGANNDNANRPAKP